MEEAESYFVVNDEWKVLHFDNIQVGVHRIETSHVSKNIPV